VLADLVAGLHLGGDEAGGVLGGLDVLDRLVEGRIEGLPDRGDPLDPGSIEGARELPEHHADAVGQRLHVGRSLGALRGAAAGTRAGHEAREGDSFAGSE